MSASVLSVNISADNNGVFHLSLDNSDFNKEMSICSGKTKTAHGIAIQEEASPDNSAGVVILKVESQATVPTKP